MHMSLAFAQEVVRAAIALADGTPRPVLVDPRAQKAVERVAREYFAGAEAAKGHCALALLVDSPVSKALGSLFLALSSAPVPRKLFAVEDDAMRVGAARRADRRRARGCLARLLEESRDQRRRRRARRLEEGARWPPGGSGTTHAMTSAS
ncbi:hypothetical protein WME91_00505 [Sorangium sp. So ce269]